MGQSLWFRKEPPQAISVAHSAIMSKGSLEEVLGAYTRSHQPFLQRNIYTLAGTVRDGVWRPLAAHGPTLKSPEFYLAYHKGVTTGRLTTLSAARGAAEAKVVFGGGEAYVMVPIAVVRRDTSPLIWTEL